ncbi:MAG: TolC family protein [Bacteroidales bacterium]|jgi:outer membrane protein TolC|nr:TolC family protein [Bacteroidales bacterium]
MKKIAIRIRVIAGIVTFMALTASARENPGVLRLTLEDALKIAMSENLTVQVADQEIQRQEYAKKGAYSALFPQISIDGSYQRTIEKQTMYMDMDVAGMSIGGIKVGRDNNWVGGVNVSMPLVSASLWKSLKISALDVELAVEKARSSRIEMIEQVTQAFYGVLLADDSYRVFKQAYENAENNYQDIKEKFEQGLVAEYDLIRADVNVRNAEPSMYGAENSLVLAHWQLKALMGIDLGIDIECTGSLAEYDRLLTKSHISMDLSLDNNSDLLQLDIQQGQMEKALGMRKAMYYPTLSAQFSYQYISMNNDFKIGHYRWDPYSTVGISLSIPIFSGGERMSNVRQTETGLRQLELQRENTERHLQVAVKQSYDRMNTCLKQYQAAKAGVKQAETGYTITMKRYETGEGTLLEINDSQLSLTQAKLNLNQSIYDYLIAESSLQKTLGNQLTVDH